MLTKTVYYTQPTGFFNSSQPDLVYHLNKSLYDLKQAPWAWCKRFASYLLSLDFVEDKSDTSPFNFRRGSETIDLLLYINDIVLITSSIELLQRTISAL
jgi:hypothetical protein